MRKFVTSKYFMVRTPLFPIQLYKKLFVSSPEKTEKNITDILKNAKIQEALEVGNLSLYKNLNYINGSDKDTRKKNQMLSSINNYLIRMSTRPTPYGIFAGVGLGEFSDETQFAINNNQDFKKRARPDMEWIYALIRELEQNQDVLRELLIKSNPLAIKRGSRIEIPYISNFGLIKVNDISGNITATIKNSDAVEFVMRNSNDYIKYKDLVALLLEKNPATRVETIEIFLNQLIANEYILTELRPQLSNVDIFEIILLKLKNITSQHNLYIKLTAIKGLITKYNNLKIGEGSTVYLEIIEMMKEIKDVKNFIQVDMNISDNIIKLNKNIGEEIEKAIEFILRITPSQKKFAHLEEYIYDFLEMYGYDREIPLLEVLDQDIGLGAPAGYQRPVSERRLKGVKRNEDNKFENYILNKIIEACRLGKRIIELSDDDIKILKPEQELNENEYPSSMELYAFIKESKNNIHNKDDFHIYVSPNAGSDVAGKTFGRFVDILPNELKTELKTINDTEKKCFNDTMIVELVELMQEGRLSNVSVNCNERDYELNIATFSNGNKIQIDPKDIYVGVERVNNKNRLYFKSKKYNKRLIFSITNMINYKANSIYSNMSKFLIEASIMDKVNIFYIINNLDFSNLSYCPRITYGKVVLAPEKWILNKEKLQESFNIKNKQIVIEKFKTWRLEWKVPQFVYLKKFDNRLLLNLENELHINELLLNLYKNNSRDIILTEVEEDLDSGFAYSNSGNYVTEIVVPLVRNIKNNNSLTLNEETKEFVFQKNTKLMMNQNIETFNEKRMFILGDQWLYFKVYGNSKRTEEFLSYYLYPLCVQLLKENLIDRFFFIMYADTEKHIRIRFNITNKSNYLLVMKKINCWSHELIKDGLLSRIVFDTYFREIERYGGIDLISYAEDVFGSDSLYSLELCKYIKENNMKENKDVIMVISIINLMKEIGLDFNEQKNLIYKRFDKKRYRKEFQVHRNELIRLCNYKEDWNNLRKSEKLSSLYNIFNIRKETLGKFKNRIIVLKNTKDEIRDLDYIILSIIHMHCNRMGISGNSEIYTMQMVRHTIQSLEYIMK